MREPRVNHARTYNLRGIRAGGERSHVNKANATLEVSVLRARVSGGERSRVIYMRTRLWR